MKTTGINKKASGDTAITSNKKMNISLCPFITTLLNLQWKLINILSKSYDERHQKR